MLIVSVNYVYYLWFSLSLLFSLASFLFYIYVSLISTSYYLTFYLLDVIGWDFSFSLYINYYSFMFTFVVLLITSVVITFSLYYMGHASNSFYFSLITVFFVLSMLLVINISDLVIVILGWDGLGVVSFFLIVHYQSPSSIFSGIFTLLINRVGDALILVSIILIASDLPVVFSSFNYSSGALSFIFVLVVGLMTNSAIFPFSPWLPAAMAAPTPISSLVHSSTLVTAGLYLIMRFSSYLYCCDVLCQVILCLGLFTSFYAGFNSLFESDLNKLVALSTLSHLGFICTSFFSGFITFSFLHLISHAMFKSLLFMSVGGFMITMDHYQDSRYISSGFQKSLFSSSLIVVSSFSLLGFPFMSGFYSNDLILESLGYSNVSLILVLVLYTNVIFTYIYTFRILLGSLSAVNTSSYSLVSSYPLVFAIMIYFLAVMSILVSLMFLWVVVDSCFVITNVNVLKFYPLFFSIISLLYFSYYSSLGLPSNSLLFGFGASMIYLSPVISNTLSKLYVYLGQYFNNSYELGIVNSMLNVSIATYVNNFVMFWGFSVLYVMILTIFIIFLLFFVVLYAYSFIGVFKGCFSISSIYSYLLLFSPTFYSADFFFYFSNIWSFF